MLHSTTVVTLCLWLSIHVRPRVRPIAEASHYKMMEETCLQSCVRGFHVYSTILNPTLGEILPCQRELTNLTDRYAAAVLESSTGTIVGHLP